MMLKLNTVLMALRETSGGDTSHFDPFANYLHGGPSTLDGDALKRHGNKGHDMGGLFFVMDSPEGRKLATMYASSKYGDDGAIYFVRINLSVDEVLDLTNEKHQKRLKSELSPQEYQYIIDSSRGGQMDWSVVDDELLEDLGFKGAILAERPEGESQYVYSVAVFNASDVEVVGQKSVSEIRMNEGSLDTVATPDVKTIAKKHGVPVSKIMTELKKGISVEKEHTTVTNDAREIALDHLSEMPDYYTKLATIDPHDLKESVIAYHGSNQERPAFKASHTGDNSSEFGDYQTQRHGTFFTNNPKFAALYGDVQQYRLNVNNTLALKSPEGEDVIYNFTQSDIPRELRIGSQQVLRGHWSIWQMFENDLGKNFVPYLQELGYDSASFYETHEDDNGDEIEGHTIVVFNPNKIQAGDLNQHQFDFMNESVGSDKFNAWFSGSKIVDRNGKPMRMYHGTGDDITHYQDMGQEVVGYFTPNPDLAAHFADDKASGIDYDPEDDAAGAIIHPVYLSIKNPFDFRNKQHVELVARETDTDPKDLASGLFDIIVDIIPELKHLGFDGHFERESTIDGDINVAAYYPNQIKSAFNRGTWSTDTRHVSEAVGSDKFNAWFSGSKIVNPDGTPKKVYHGSPDIRGILDQGFQAQFNGNFFFFTDQYSVANTYTDEHRAFDFQNAEGNVVSAYLNIKNPLVINGGHGHWRDVQAQAKAAVNDGYDGVIIKNIKDEYGTHKGSGKSSTVYIAYSPKQIYVPKDKPMTSRHDRRELPITHKHPEIDESYSPEDYTIPQQHIPTAIENGISPAIANRYGDTYRHDYEAMARDMKRDAEYRRKDEEKEQKRAKMISTLDKISNSGGPLSMTELVHVIANDDDLYNTLAEFQGGDPDIFDTDMKSRDRLDSLMRRMTPTKLGYALYRGETKFGDDVRHPREFHSWTPAKDIAADFNDNRHSYMMSYNGPVQGFSFNDVVDARMRLRPGTNHYAGPQTQWLIIDPPKEDIQISESASYNMWNEKHIVWEQGEFKIAVNTPDDPSYYTVWTEDNKRIGYLSLTPKNKKGTKWMSIDSVEIDKNYRGQGLGIALYRVALNTIDPECLGLYSYLPNVANKRLVPTIHRSLGGVEVDGDHMFIPRNEEARNVLNIINESVDHDTLNGMIEEAIDIVINDMDWGGGDGEMLQDMYLERYYDEDSEEYDELQGADPYELFTENENFNKFVKAYFYRDATYAVNEISSKIDGDTISVYRVITAPKDWNPEAQPLGIYWSWDARAAEAHWMENHSHEYTISGDVHVDNVEWALSIALNIHPSLGDEREIRVVEGSPVVINEILQKHNGQHDTETYNYLVGKKLPA